MAHDTLYAIGEALIDMIPSKTGCSFANVPSFSPRVGGAPKILRDSVEPLCIDFLDGMICGKLPLLPSTKIPDLTAGAPAFVSGSQTVTVLGISCVSGQKPFSADGAFPRRVSDA